MKLSDKWYNKLKVLAQYVLPGSATLYFALAEIWHLPARAEVVASITAIDTFLGVLLGISSKNFHLNEPRYAGDIVVTETDKKKTFSLDIGIPVDELDRQSEVVFRIVNK
jgi:voltage-gated potassium channel Kch